MQRTEGNEGSEVFLFEFTPPLCGAKAPEHRRTPKRWRDIR